MAIAAISRRARDEHLTWDLQRNNDVLIVGFDTTLAEGWGELFDAMKTHVDMGARIVVFPRHMPPISIAGMAVFRELARYLIRSGVAVRRGTVQRGI